ncbi:DUF485 domain-containing protein [Streptomyces sp. NPDC002018]|uniref:DUF485 domain-containing protein n=1 Tax=Streptomyces sp. NPDC002018 TaxID=3364629 RepID=UPI0036BEFCE5
MEKQEGRDAAAVRLDDPWYEALASDWGEPAGSGSPTAPAPPGGDAAPGYGYGTYGDGESAYGDGYGAYGDGDGAYGAGGLPAAEIYLRVRRGAAFQEVKSRYRRFVVPASLAFFLWYFAYVVAATAAPELMARPVMGAVNVAMAAGLGQFLSTFLLTWAYARHARLRRDRAALELRWSVFDQARPRGPGVDPTGGRTDGPADAPAGEPAGETVRGRAR